MLVNANGERFTHEMANISGGAAAHHFVTIGAFAYVGGMTRMVQDVPPFMILEGHPSRVRGVNVIGLQRGGLPDAEIEHLRTAFKRVFRSGDPRKRTLEDMKQEFAGSALVERLVRSLERTELGAKGRYRESLRATFMEQGKREILGEVAAV